jgi:hypothetical protein
MDEQKSKMPNSALYEQFAQDYADGKYDTLYAHVLPFVLKNVGDFSNFIDSLGGNAEGLNTLTLLKLYIFEKNMPFDMTLYMKEQSEFIRKSIQDDGKDRQQAVAEWIQQHAQRHREMAIRTQCLYLDKIADKIIPDIEKALQNYRERQAQK